MPLAGAAKEIDVGTRIDSCQKLLLLLLLPKYLLTGS
jgi:hypothetical protein